MRTLGFTVGTGSLAFPRAAAGDAGIFSSAANDVVRALGMAIGEAKGAGKLREESVAIGIAKGAIAFVPAGVFGDERSECTVQRAKM